MKRYLKNTLLIQIVSILFAAVLFVFIPSLPWNTLSGTGLNITLNLLSWLWLGVAVMGMSVLLHNRRLRGNRILFLLGLGCVLMTIPLCWTVDEFRAGALSRLAGLWALAALMWLFVQIPVKNDLRRNLYIVVVAGGMIQVVLAIWQVLFPASASTWLNYNAFLAGGRPLGGLLQANLLGSFLATALSCAVWLYLSAQRGAKHLFVLNGFSVLFVCAGLVLTQSRSAQAAAALVVLLMLSGIKKARCRRRFLTIMFFLAVGIMCGVGMLHARASQLQMTGADAKISSVDTTVSADTRSADARTRLEMDRRASEAERFTLLKGAMVMIVEHPLAGLGLGSFEVQFPAALARAGMVNPFTVTVQHPHNELLYVWSEGGILALAGFLIWLSVWFIPFRYRLTSFLPYAQWCNKVNSNGRKIFSRGLLTLPLFVHVMTEFPVYLSALHGILLILLVRLALPVSVLRPTRKNLPKRLNCCCRILPVTVFLGGACGVLFMSTALQSSFKIQDAELFSLMDTTSLNEIINPYAQSERLEFDDAVNDLMQFNFTRDASFLAQFQKTAGHWLSSHNDANLIWSMMRIAAVQQDKLQAQYWKVRGCLSFAQDVRFECPDSSSVPVTARLLK